MSAAATDYLTHVGSPGTATTLAAPGHSIAGTAFTVVSTSNWPTDTGVIFAIDTYDTGTGERVPGSYTEWEGVVASSTSITGGVLRYGTDQNYSAGSTTRVYIPVSSSRENRLVDGLLVEHKQTGAHAVVTADSVTVATGKITTTTVGKLEDAAIPLTTYRTNYSFDFVASGGVWSGDAYASTKAASMTAITCFINGRRIVISAVTARTFTASKDTYIDVLDNADGTGTLVYTEVTNNAASPALAANSLRIGIIVTGATNIAAAGSVNQGQETMILPIASSIAYAVTDSLGNLICPRDPNRNILGYRQITTTFSTASTSATQVTGLSCPVIVPTGRKIKITVYTNSSYNSAAAYFDTLSIWDGVVNSGTKLDDATINGKAANQQLFLSPVAITTPATASKTYNAGFSVDTGTGSVVAAATTPAYILVELI